MRLRLAHLSVAALLAVSLSAHADSLIGSTVDVTYAYPTFANVATDSGPVTVTPGLEIVSSQNANLTFNSGTEITITNPGLGPFNSFPFNGFNVSILSGAVIDSVTLDPSSDSDFAPGVVISFTGNDIEVNLQGTCGTCGPGNQNIYLDVNATPASATPEPSSLVLLGTGLVSALGAMRKRFA